MTLLESVEQTLQKKYCKQNMPWSDWDWIYFPFFFFDYGHTSMLGLLSKTLSVRLMWTWRTDLRTHECKNNCHVVLAQCGPKKSSFSYFSKYSAVSWHMTWHLHPSLTSLASWDAPTPRKTLAVLTCSQRFVSRWMITEFSNQNGVLWTTFNVQI